jgi:cell division protein FtsI (penicillin-binding protein 3)
MDAVDQRRVATPLPAARGEIMDRNGSPIAISDDGRAVSGQPRVIRQATCLPDAKKPCSAGTIAAALAPVLNLPVGELTEKLNRDTGFVYLARDLDVDVGNRVRALGLLGVRVDPEPRRVHPGGDLAANVVGFTNRESQGAAGIELAYDKVLTGKDGRSVAEVDSKGRVIPSGEERQVDPVQGRDVQLTIDRDLQWQAQQVLSQKVQETQAASGSAIVMDIRTGEILAMADAPTFDPDAPSAAPEGDRGSRSLATMFDPGSINKIITMSAALETGVVKPSDVLTVPYSQQFGAKLVVDAERHPTEDMTVNGVFMHSSNVGTVQIAERLGAERLTDYLRAYGFGSRTGIGLPGESAGLVPDAADWSGSSMGTIPIGQGISVTAVQVASVVQTLANDGVRVTPTLVKAVGDGNGQLVPTRAPEQRRVISAATAQAMHPMLEGVVTVDGTAPLAAIPGYRIAGKTGTADRAVNGRYDGSYTSSFVGFAPADAPRLATVVILEGTGKNGYFGGSTAGPVFKQLMGFALRSTDTPPTGVPFVAPPVYADGRK